MRIVSVVIVEDDVNLAAVIANYFGNIFNNVEVEIIHTETDFIKSFDTYEIKPPDIFIMDMIFPWSKDEACNNDSGQAEQRNQFFAGFRCLDLLRGNKKTSSTPVVICSTLGEKEIRREINDLPIYWVILRKPFDSEHLAIWMRSLVPDLRLKANNEFSSKQIMAAVTLNPSFMGLSIDLKKIFRIFSKKKKS